MQGTPSSKTSSKIRKKRKPQTKGSSLKFKMVESKDIRYKNLDAMGNIEKAKKKYFMMKEYNSSCTADERSNLKKHSAQSQSIDINKYGGKPKYGKKY